MAIPVSNAKARRIFLERQGLAAPPGAALGKAGLLAMIERLGFVQVDSIRTVERAHHMILFSRNQTYRQTDLEQLIEKDRSLFEHWTHDASVIPMAFYPYWQRRFAAEAQIPFRRRRFKAQWRLSPSRVRRVVLGRSTAIFKASSVILGVYP